MFTLLYCRILCIRYNKVKVGKKDKELFFFPTFKTGDLRSINIWVIASTTLAILVERSLPKKHQSINKRQKC